MDGSIRSKGLFFDFELKTPQPYLTYSNHHLSRRWTNRRQFPEKFICSWCQSFTFSLWRNRLGITKNQLEWINVVMNLWIYDFLCERRQWKNQKVQKWNRNKGMFVIRKFCFVLDSLTGSFRSKFLICNSLLKSVFKIIYIVLLWPQLVGSNRLSKCQVPWVKILPCICSNFCLKKEIFLWHFHFFP